MSLTNQQHITFCLDYLKHFNASEAARTASYSLKTAGSIGFNLLKRPDIQKYLRDTRDRLVQEAEIELMDIIRHLRDMAFFDIRTILTDSGAIKPIKEWPDIACKIISGLKVTQQVFNNDIIEVTDVKIPSREKNTENLGRYVGAFTDNMKVDTGDGVKKVFVFPGFKPGMAIPTEEDGGNGRIDGDNGNSRAESDDGNGSYTED